MWCSLKIKSFNKLVTFLTLFAFLGTSKIVFAKDVISSQKYKIARIGGLDRFETSINIANHYSSETLQSIILSSGNDFPDSLSGTVLAESVKSPILLVNKTADTSMKTLNYIENKLDKNGNIYILGGTGVIGEDIITYLTDKGFKNFVRLGGNDRFETNTKITNELNVSKGTPLVLVNANNFPDALSISSIAAIKGYPIVLTNSNTLSSSAKDIITNTNPSSIFLIGGNGSLNSSIITDIKILLPNISDTNLIRIGGKDRYETSSMIMKYFNLDTTNCVLASGENFPDGVAGGALAAKLNAPILLINDASLNSQQLQIEKTNASSITILGSEGAISLNIEKCFSKYLYGFDCATAYSAQKYQEFKDAGYSFICRYYCDTNPNKAWKNCLTTQEVKDISNIGLKIVPIYQDGGKYIDYFTSSQGKIDCQKAIDIAKKVGQPTGTPIYFAVDFDAVTTNDFKAIDEYFKSIKDTMNENLNYYSIGVYGGFFVVNEVTTKLGEGTYAWQTSSWSNNKISSISNLYQYDHDVTVLGINIDRDRTNASNDNYGGFSVNK